jgi:hypothetical protein
MGAASVGCRSNCLPHYLMKDFEENVTNGSPQNTPTVVRALIGFWVITEVPWARSTTTMRTDGWLPKSER